jgi:hypothetical protein
MSGGVCGNMCSCMSVMLQGLTPLHWAAYDGHGECVAALLEAGSDINAKDREVCQEKSVVMCAHA